MKAKIKLVYPDHTDEHTIEWKGRPGPRMMDTLNGVIDKRFKDDPDWERWELIDVEVV